MRYLVYTLGVCGALLTATACCPDGNAEANAKAKIEAAGGSVEVVPGRKKWVREAAAANA